ncbi:efflux RND transporter periplasmic adaptor subunit [uncultured Rhodoblastus sp.]|uniref:efflux RND transporter periplasmic adaptor subunit n=1 Tax=uncultured Rhodoblastus sp. TaxID=543037 RepID=UPI0025FC80A4|nr:efflux RND transporter periplasmic adaptor subunit [uncultured Rhodoblastus sp.]
MVDLMRKWVFLAVFFGLSVLVGGMAWFQFKAKPEMMRGIMSSIPKPVSGVAVEEAREEIWTPRVSVIGTFKAVPGIDVSGQVAGMVAEIAFANGQDVAKGALLARIDDSTEQAELRSNAAMLKNAELAFQRQQMLTDHGVAAKSNFDLANAVRDQAAGALDRTRALIAQKTIVAPFAGRLGIRKVDVGQYVAAGAPLVSLQQLDPIFLDFQVPEQNFAALALGGKVSARVDALGGGEFAGKIGNFDARVDRDTRTILVRAEIANPDKKIMPGMFANVTLDAGAPQKMVTAPRTAVAFSLYGDSVFVVRPDDAEKGFDGPLHVERRNVSIGESREDRVVLKQGVAAGDKIVSQGQIKLQPNAAVRIETGLALRPQAVRPLQ